MRNQATKILMAVALVAAASMAVEPQSTVKAVADIRPAINLATDSKLAQEINCLALNIYHEARGEPVQGKYAVGHVVMNRVIDPRFPKNVCKVVAQGGERRDRCQFSWWCDGRRDRPTERRSWLESKELARQIYLGMSADPTNGALWYHANYVKPYWKNSFKRGPKIGRHIFYQPPGPKKVRARFGWIMSVDAKVDNPDGRPGA